MIGAGWVTEEVVSGGWGRGVVNWFRDSNGVESRRERDRKQLNEKEKG